MIACVKKLKTTISLVNSVMNKLSTVVDECRLQIGNRMSLIEKTNTEISEIETETLKVEGFMKELTRMHMDLTKD